MSHEQGHNLSNETLLREISDLKNWIYAGKDAPPEQLQRLTELAQAIPGIYIKIHSIYQSDTSKFNQVQQTVTRYIQSQGNTSFLRELETLLGNPLPLPSTPTNFTPQYQAHDIQTQERGRDSFVSLLKSKISYIMGALGLVAIGAVVHNQSENKKPSVDDQIKRVWDNEQYKAEQAQKTAEKTYMGVDPNGGLAAGIRLSEHSTIPGQMASRNESEASEHYDDPEEVQRLLEIEKQKIKDAERKAEKLTANRIWHKADGSSEIQLIKTKKPGIFTLIENGSNILADNVTISGDGLTLIDSNGKDIARSFGGDGGGLRLSFSGHTDVYK